MARPIFIGPFTRGAVPSIPPRLRHLGSCTPTGECGARTRATRRVAPLHGTAPSRRRTVDGATTRPADGGRIQSGAFRRPGTRVRNRRVGSDPDSLVDAAAQVFGKVTVDVGIDYGAWLVGSQRRRHDGRSAGGLGNRCLCVHGRKAHEREGRETDEVEQSHGSDYRRARRVVKERGQERGGRPSPPDHLAVATHIRIATRSQGRDSALNIRASRSRVPVPSSWPATGERDKREVHRWPCSPVKNSGEPLHGDRARTGLGT